ncbi:LysM peptidoglycan-binding domain-containing protein [Microbispora sp. NEAU-D428]|uniref:LysM peptidoglycan-binding domain-containing protein n=1 Tax=Microbispora sitophila TaxID=2771537 RepID=UPI001868C783|nr:LysM peptidoglycan-binding domain-containing protein [Microbispora sitophila]MBE3013087.1 LysM peptidoglycan-binding domain-containing protein [Microbispora sitophila]
MTRFRLLDGLRALLAAAVLTALIAGVPLVLYALAGSPVPAHLPGLGEIGHALTHRDDGTLFLAVVKAASWAAWASFVASTLIEVASRIRGRATPHLPGLGAAQWLSAQLISSVALAAGSPAAFVMAAVPPAAVIAAAPAALADTATASPDAGHDPLRFTGADTSSEAGQLTTTRTHGPSDQAHARVLRLTHSAYQVRRGDCLWTIAERHLGDGDRYTEIADLNMGRVMTDGARFTQPDVIRPGWVLRMPAVATDLDRAQPPIPDRHPSHPSDAPEFSRPHDGAPSSPQPPAVHKSPNTGELPAAGRDEAPPAHTPHPQQARASAPEPTAILLTDGAEADDSGPSTPVAAFAGGVAVGSLLTLARLRHAQRQARRRGRRIALPADPDTLRTEQELRRLAAPDAHAHTPRPGPARRRHHRHQPPPAARPRRTRQRRHRRTAAGPALRHATRPVHPGPDQGGLAYRPQQRTPRGQLPRRAPRTAHHRIPRRRTRTPGEPRTPADRHRNRTRRPGRPLPHHRGHRTHHRRQAMV